MDVLGHIARLELADKASRIELLEDLGDLAEAKALSAEEAVLVMQHLLEVALTESDDEVRESALNALGGAADVYRSMDVPWDDLVQALPRLDRQATEHAIYILGVTLDKRYLATVESFCDSDDKGIRITARHAAALLRKSGPVTKEQ